MTTNATAAPDTVAETEETAADAQTRQADEHMNGAPLPPVRRKPQATRWRRLHQSPLLRLTVYYVLLVTVAALLVRYAPAVRTALFAPVTLPAVRDGVGMITGRGDLAELADPGMPHILERALTTFLVIVGALALVVPVAWVYMLTKRFRFDPALVRSVVILPIVVAGIAMVVKNSIALAFALAGIVAAVRFRNTLKDPRDAVYIFLVIGIGLSAGVQALDVALIMSLTFNLVVLVMWWGNLGSIYGGRYGRTGILSVGDSRFMVAETPDTRKQLRKRLLDEAEEMKTDGILLVHSDNPDLARHTVQEAFGELAKDWRLVGIAPRGAQLSTLEYLVRLKKKSTPPELVGALGERWSAQVSAAEYIPFRVRSKERD